MKTLLKISVLALATGFTQGVSATTFDLGTLSNFDNAVFKNAVSGKYQPFDDTFKFKLDTAANISVTLTSVFSSAAKNFSSFTATFSSYNAAGDLGTKQEIASFAVLDGKYLKGGFEKFNLSAVDKSYEIFVTGKTGDFQKSKYVGSLALSAGTEPTMVPEPEEWAMMMLGLPLMGFVARRRRAA